MNLFDLLSIKVSDDSEADDNEDDKGDLVTGADQGREHQRIGRRPENVTMDLDNHKISIIIKL